MLKKILIGLGVVVLLLVAAVLVGPRLVDWNAYKPRVIEAVRNATGRELAIDGNISVSLLPTPTLSVAGVRLANLQGASAPDMARLKSLDISVALMPLISGNVQVTKVTLVDPVVELERLPDGRVNWLFAPTASAPASGAVPTQPATGSPGPGGSLPSISVDNFGIVNGTVIYRSGPTEEKIEALNAAVAARSLTGPFTAKGDAKLAGILAHFDAAVGRLGVGPTDLQLLINMAGDAAILKFDGTADQAAATLKGKLDAKIAEPGVLLQIAGARGLPPALTKPFTLTSSIDASAKSIELPDLALSLGDDKATGNIAVQLGSPVLVDASLAFGRLDLDKLLPEIQPAPPAEAPSGVAAAPTASGTAPTTPAAPAAPAPIAAGFLLPPGIAASLHVSAESIVYRQATIAHPTLVAHLADGELEIKQFSANLPGSSDVSLSGTVASKDGLPQFVGAVQAKSTNFRELITWLGARIPPLAGDRLHNFTMTSRIIASQRQAELADLDVRLDATRIQGGVNVALPDGTTRLKPGFGIGLAVDSLDLDSYMPVPGSTAPSGAAIGGATTAAATGGAVTSAAAVPAKKASPLAALAPLADLDANFDFRAGTLTLNHQPVRGLHLQGTLFGGKLTIADASAKDIGGGQGTISGSIVSLAKDPRYDLKLDLAAPDASQVFQLAGFGKSQPGKLGALKVNGAVKGGADDVDFDLAFAVTGVGVQGAAKGNAQGLQGGIPRVNSTVSASAKNAGPLFQLFGMPAAAAAKLGTLNLSGVAKSGQDSVDYNLVLDLPGIGGKGNFQGQVVSLSKSPRVTTTLKFDAAQPGPLLALAGFSGPGADKLGAMSLAGKANTAPDVINYDLTLDMPGMGGKGAFQGQVTALSSKTPQVATNLKLDVAQPGPLLSLAGVNGATAGKLGALGISGRLDGGVNAMKLNLNLAALGGTSTVQGTVAAAKTPVAFDLTIAANHPNAAALMSAVLPNFRGGGGNPGPFKLNAHVAGDARKFALNNFALQSANNDLSGTGTIGLGSRPSVQGSFASNNFNLGLLTGGGGGGGQMAPAQGGGQGQAAQQVPQPQPQAVPGGGHWSRQPIDFSALDKMDAALDYKAGHLYSGTTRIDNLVAKINLAAGVLAIQNLSGQVYGGSFTIQNGRVVSRGTPSISGRVITSNLEISQLVRTGSVKGPVSVNADLAGTGASEAAIVASLQGKGKIAGRVTILGTAEQAAGTALLNVLGKQLSAVRGITGALSTAVNLFVGRPSDLAGDFSVTRGVVTTQNLTATNPQARALVHGDLQLPPWTMTMLADIYQLPQTAKPVMTVSLQGPIDKPNVGIKGGSFQQQNQGGQQQTNQSGNPLQQLLQGGQQQPQGGQGTKTDPLAPLLQQLLKKTP
ncbi:MAG TPA: AsmA family protein [Verrucomicrobiae bacterium]|nr:AsmA family protein [Verrucomicrobiae bacterium]